MRSALGPCSGACSAAPHQGRLGRCAGRLPGPAALSERMPPSHLSGGDVGCGRGHPLPRGCRALPLPRGCKARVPSSRPSPPIPHRTPAPLIRLYPLTHPPPWLWWGEAGTCHALGRGTQRWYPASDLPCGVQHHFRARGRRPEDDINMRINGRFIPAMFARHERIARGQVRFASVLNSDWIACEDEPDFRGTSTGRRWWLE